MSEQRETEDNKRNRGRTANNTTTTGFRISNELWAVCEPLLPAHVNTHRCGGGRPRVADLDVTNLQEETGEQSTEGERQLKRVQAIRERLGELVKKLQENLQQGD